VDEALRSGPVDGQGEFHSYPFTGSGSAGFPAADTVLRSYLGHPALEVMPSPDEYDADEATAEEAAEVAVRHRLTDSDAYEGVLLHRTGTWAEADIVVTVRGWLLAERERPHRKNLSNVFTPEEALAVIGLYLFWHHQPIIVGGSLIRWPTTSGRRSVAFTAMRAFERWNQAGRAWFETDGNLALETLNQTLLTRISRAFNFRGNIFSLCTTMVDHEPEEMLSEFDSLLVTLVGSFDVAARIVDLTLQLNSRRVNGWQDGQWQSRLQTVAADLHDYTKPGREMQRTFQVLRWLRNSVHNEALDLTVDDGVHLIALPASIQNDLKDFLREGHPGWTASSLGLRAQPPGGATAAKWLPGTGRYSVTVRRTGAPLPLDPLDGQLVLDVRPFINKIFPATLTTLNRIMQLTPLTGVPGYCTAMEQPPRVHLPWRFSDTTGHRLSMCTASPNSPDSNPVSAPPELCGMSRS
jgi:hypothetical protein